MGATAAQHATGHIGDAVSDASARAPSPGPHTGPATGRIGGADSVDGVLRRVLDDEAARWPHVGGASVLLEDLRGAVLDGGKRLRSTFSHWGFIGAAGTAPDQDGDHLGAALELLHTFALVHDDVMDGSPVRRGSPSAHARFSAEHRQHGWRGEQRRFGEGMAVLVGDLAFTLAHRLVAPIPAVHSIWYDMCGELVLGQYLDLRGTAGGERADSYATLVASLKSGRYTVVRPLQLGAALAGGGVDGDPHAAERLNETYAAYGEPVGEAFQLRDDLLDVLGDPAQTGKPVGADFREGKPTLVLALTAERAPRSARPLLERVGAPDLTDAEVAAITELAIETGACSAVDARIAAAVEQGCAALDGSSVDQAAVKALRALAEQAAWRDR